jgi:hypothetical protein
MYTRMYVCMYVCMYINVPSSRCDCFVNLRPAENLLHERGHVRVPSCNVLEMFFFYFL